MSGYFHRLNPAAIDQFQGILQHKSINYYYLIELSALRRVLRLLCIWEVILDRMPEPTSHSPICTQTTDTHPVIIGVHNIDVVFELAGRDEVQIHTPRGG